MKIGKSIFTQLMEFAPRYQFDKCVNRYNGHYKVLRFTCWEQFLCMAFAQLTYRESLRDIEACLRSKSKKLYHIGIRNRVSRNTLANANSKRDWHIYQDFGHILIERANNLYKDDNFAAILKDTVYALDSTSIELCVSLFPWAAYSKRQGAVCIHTLLNLRGNIPSVIVITDKTVSELKVLDQLIIEPGAIYVLDRGYIDYTRFRNIHQNQAFFVTRAKADLVFKKVYSNETDKAAGIKYDWVVTVRNPDSKKVFPWNLRLIKFYDSKTETYLVFLSNNMSLSAKTISDLYRSRWQIELFFKWIKQHLRIKAFYGRSENAVKTQIWIAVSAYVLVAIIKKELKVELSLYTILQILSVSLFENIKITDALSDFKIQRSCPELEAPLLFNQKTLGQ